MLQKSNTFSSLSAVSKRSTTTIGSWFDRRARKLSMKCSKSITLGKKKGWAARVEHRKYQEGSV